MREATRVDSTDEPWLLIHEQRNKLGDLLEPLASIILAITGRPAGLDDLTASGLDTMRLRI